MLTYKNETDANNDISLVRVFLDGRRIGSIEPVTGYEDKQKYWRYVPKTTASRKKYAGELGHSIAVVKATLET